MSNMRSSHVFSAPLSVQSPRRLLEPSRQRLRAQGRVSMFYSVGSILAMQRVHAKASVSNIHVLSTVKSFCRDPALNAAWFNDPRRRGDTLGISLGFASKDRHQRDARVRIHTPVWAAWSPLAQRRGAAPSLPSAQRSFNSRSSAFCRRDILPVPTRQSWNGASRTRRGCLCSPILWR